MSLQSFWRGSGSLSFGDWADVHCTGSHVRSVAYVYMVLNLTNYDGKIDFFRSLKNEYDVIYHNPNIDNKGNITVRTMKLTLVGEFSENT